MPSRIGSYRLGRTLGIGTFSKVKFGIHEPTGKRVAIKILNKRKLRDMEMEHKVKREIEISAILNHPHVIRLYEVVETPTDIYVVMEYVARGELFDYIVTSGRLSENEARRFFQQLIAGVEYCHVKGIVHRDLKPENLLLDDDYNLRIADFGLSNVMNDGMFLTTSCGSPNYAAPEVICDELYAGPEVDVWSCGVILYALLVGQLPFDDDNIPNLFRKIKNVEYTLPNNLPQGAAHLIRRMLCKSPMKRVTIKEIRKDPWFLVDLPKYLSIDPLKSILFTEKKVNTKIVTLCSTMRYTKNEVESALKLGSDLILNPKYRARKYLRWREAAVCYHLHYDKHYRMKYKSIIKPKKSTKDVNMDNLDVTHHTLKPEEEKKIHLKELQRRLGVETDDRYTTERTYNNPNFSVKWRVGMWTTFSPEQFMTHILESLVTINMEWIIQDKNPYCVVARVIIDKTLISNTNETNSKYKIKKNRSKKSKKKIRKSISNENTISTTNIDNINKFSTIKESSNSSLKTTNTKDRLITSESDQFQSLSSPTFSDSNDTSCSDSSSDSNTSLVKKFPLDDPNSKHTIESKESKDSSTTNSNIREQNSSITSNEENDLSEVNKKRRKRKSNSRGSENDMNVPEFVQIKIQLYVSTSKGNSGLDRVRHNMREAHHNVGSHTHHRHGHVSHKHSKRHKELLLKKRNSSREIESDGSYKYYLLDLQKIKGDTFPFLDLCANLMGAIKYLPPHHY